ncbi:hypothetical protein A3H38_02745 [candidate division WOR-1 bacterium RIFCSPLOWO2_02_FULL_46_20]|uniref:Cytochrome c domain-containing protein n=1 Tax=candidate division WOR-1 bacterium RIFCSPLOWO2_02_FULL_46_20 TaxID=1802567 RepID=A0A1F4R8U1_UNCSA|nr:MAG: hypothetical protein A3J44_05945 [candidate division WOR-1 bacterium RIFCSPHIGHO2_02_FULL_45_12]OGC04570.1 MAG: hypothetical protein A3H38_02745 [candidate division WOR-1 bacterium RIFCSPLOWO2_02_FULL_46_20]
MVLIFSSALLISGCVPDEEQSAAYKLYSAKCSSCHRLLPPEDYPLEKFGEYIEKYGKELTPEEKTRLLDGLRAYKKLKEEQK